MNRLTKVVHMKKEPFDVYIGRNNQARHYGNPFAIGKSSISQICVATREEAIQSFHDWLEGTSYTDVEPKRRQWILDSLESLRGKTLGCFCKPQACHGDVFRVLLGELDLKDLDLSKKSDEQTSEHEVLKQEDQQLGLF